MNDMPKIVTVTKFTPLTQPDEHAEWLKGFADALPKVAPEPEQPDPIPPREHGPFWRGTHE